MLSFRMRKSLAVVLTFMCIAMSLSGMGVQVTAQEETKHLVITEIMYDAPGSDDGPEYIEIMNVSEEAIDISGYLIGDEEEQGGNEGMASFPEGTTINPKQVIVLAQSSSIFKDRYGIAPDYEFPVIERYNPVDDPEVPNLLASDWSTGTLILANGGDQVIFLNNERQLIDFVPFITDSAFNGTLYKAAPQFMVSGETLQRKYITGDASIDFIPKQPTIGIVELSDIPPEEPVDLTSKTLLITEVLYDPFFDEVTGEFIEFTNISDQTIDLSGYQIGDEETQGAGEGMFTFPEGASIGPNEVIVVARNAEGIMERYGVTADYEVDDHTVEGVTRLLPSDWATGTLAMANTGDHAIIMDPHDNVIDVFNYKGGTFYGVNPHPGSNGGESIERISETDSNDNATDFVVQPNPTPGTILFGPHGDPSKIPVSDLKENVTVAKEPVTGIVLPPTVIGFGGDAKNAPENTMAAIDRLLESNTPSVLLPVRATRDGKLILMKDETLNRTTNGSGRVDKQLWSDIQLLDAGINFGKTFEGERVPLLTDVLKKIDGVLIPIIQIEEAHAVDELLQVIEELNIQDVHFVSSNPDIVSEIRGIEDEARGAILYKDLSLNQEKLKEIVKTTRKSKANVAILTEEAATKETIRYLAVRGITVWAWGAEHQASADRLIARGIAGVISNNPTGVIDALSQYESKTMTQKPIVMAHRGMPALKPENTLISFEEAIRQGADMIETDVHKTKDGHLVVIHDFDLERTTDGTGKVKDFTLEELRKLNANQLDPANPTWYHPELGFVPIPTLDEVLELAKGRIVLSIEAKGIGYEKEIADKIREHGMVEDVLVTSFSPEIVKRFAQIDPELGLGFILNGVQPLEKKHQYAEKYVTDNIQMNSLLSANIVLMTPELINYAKHRGLQIWAWTLNDEAIIRQALELGALGIITDHADLMPNIQF